LATDFIQNSPEYDQYRRIALIVDHDLAHLDEYNARTRPIAGDLLLPRRFSLVYASYDQGGEYFANQIIRHADCVANLCLEKIEDGTVALAEKDLGESAVQESASAKAYAAFPVVKFGRPFHDLDACLE
jgi:hypothetical protein